MHSSLSGTIWGESYVDKTQILSFRLLYPYYSFTYSSLGFFLKKITFFQKIVNIWILLESNKRAQVMLRLPGNIFYLPESKTKRLTALKGHVVSVTGWQQETVFKYNAMIVPFWKLRRMLIQKVEACASSQQRAVPGLLTAEWGQRPWFPNGRGRCGSTQLLQWRQYTVWFKGELVFSFVIIHLLWPQCLACLCTNFQVIINNKSWVP